MPWQGKKKEKTGPQLSSVCRPKEPSVSCSIHPSGPSVPRFWGWAGLRVALGTQLSWVAFWLHPPCGAPVRPQQSWEWRSQAVHCPVSEEETEAQARSLLCRFSVRGCLVDLGHLGGPGMSWKVGLEAPAARPVHSHLCKAQVSTMEMTR